MTSLVPFQDRVPNEACSPRRRKASSTTRRIDVAVLSLSLSAVVLAGCATSGFDLADSQIISAYEQGEGSVFGSGSFASTDPGPYLLQPGDLLELQFFFNPELDRRVRVQPDGAVTVPLLGTRPARGMSIPELTEMVRVAYAQELKQPRVVVQLIEASPRQVYVGGAVNDPQQVAFREGLSPLEVVLAAGGFDTTAKTNTVILIRKDDDGRPIPAIVDLEDMVLYGDSAVALRPWDIVFVPKDEISKANEWVDKYLSKLLLINGISFGYRLNPDNDD